MWGSHRVIYVFTDATDELYYDIKLKEPLKVETAGGKMFPATRPLHLVRAHQLALHFGGQPCAGGIWRIHSMQCERVAIPLRDRQGRHGAVGPSADVLLAVQHPIAAVLAREAACRYPL